MKGYLQAKGIFEVSIPFQGQWGEYLLLAMKDDNMVPLTEQMQYHTQPYTMVINSQNEILIRYGLTRVLAIDGYSSKVVSFASMPIKNNLKIYDKIYR